MKTFKYALPLLFASFFISACGKNSDVTPEKPAQQETVEKAKPVVVEADAINKVKADPKPIYSNTLRDAFSGIYLIGAADKGPELPAEERVILNREFNVITPENAGKWEPMQPQPGKFKFTEMDRLVASAEEHGQEVVGHVLVWGNQTPKWVFQNEARNGPASKALLLKRMKEHIDTVVGRYKGRIKYLDVVNEAILGDGSYRKNDWYKILGKDYIHKAFEYAHAADPDAHLIYNDYGMTKPSKVKSVIAMIKELQATGQTIHGIGLQGHWLLEFPSVKDIDHALQSFADTGLKIHISELDLSILPSPYDGASITNVSEYRADYDPYKDGVTSEALEKQAQRMRVFFELFDKVRDSMERVTFWGVGDASSWRNWHPMRGRTDYALLFDRHLKKKPVYNVVKEMGYKSQGVSR